MAAVSRCCIESFCRQRPREWNIYVETSLNVALHHLEQVAPWVNRYYVDVKDMNEEVYTRYTGHDNQQVQHNLRWLVQEQRQDQVTIRLPLISGYNTEAHRAASQQLLEDMGFRHFDRFNYIVKD